MSLTPSLPQGKNGSKSIAALLDDALRLDSFTVATLPAAADHTGKLVAVSNGAAGSPCLAYSDGTNWKVVALGATVS